MTGAVRSCREVRWFVRGELDEALRPTKRPTKRNDDYFLPTLTPLTSLKRRNGVDPEFKVRVGPVELLQHGDLLGFAETWTKARGRIPRPAGADPCDWITVSKQRWCDHHLEVAQLSVLEERWWTVCLEVDTEHALSSPALDPWRPALIERSWCASYATWLLRITRTTEGARR